MLAQTFRGGGHVRWPVLVQPKIDGIRCTASLDDEKRVVLRTRTGIVMTSPYLDRIRSSLVGILTMDTILDGELSSPDSPFEVLSGACRTTKLSDPVRVIFNVFDMIVPGVGFEERFGRVVSIIPDAGQEEIRIVPTMLVDDVEGVDEHHDRFVRDGHEGIIVRNRDGLYRPGKRSWDLQKHKKFREEEFVITGYAEGTGVDKGTVVWECATPGGIRFHARPMGSREHRTRLLTEASDHVGSPLTVVYQGLTRHGVPRFPVAKGVRSDGL